MDSPRGDEQELPGMGEPAPNEGAIERAARRTIAALEDAGLLNERDALLCQSTMTIARAYDRAASSARAKEYAIAQLHAQLLATIEALPVPEDSDDDDPWTALERQVAEDARKLREQS